MSIVKIVQKSSANSILGDLKPGDFCKCPSTGGLALVVGKSTPDRYSAFDFNSKSVVLLNAGTPIIKVEAKLTFKTGACAEPEITHNSVYELHDYRAPLAKASSLQPGDFFLNANTGFISMVLTNSPQFVMTVYCFDVSQTIASTARLVSVVDATIEVKEL